MSESISMSILFHKVVHNDTHLTVRTQVPPCEGNSGNTSEGESRVGSPVRGAHPPATYTAVVEQNGLLLDGVQSCGGHFIKTHQRATKRAWGKDILRHLPEDYCQSVVIVKDRARTMSRVSSSSWLSLSSSRSTASGSPRCSRKRPISPHAGADSRRARNNMCFLLLSSSTTTQHSRTFQDDVD